MKAKRHDEPGWAEVLGYIAWGILATGFLLWMLLTFGLFGFFLGCFIVVAAIPRD